jgi:hypothetical protein
MTHRTRALATFVPLAALLVGCGDATLATGEAQYSTEGPPLAYLDYQVLFTNPTCADYPYGQEVHSEGGELLTQKPKDAFCTHDDINASGDRAESPQHQLLEWINDPETTEIFFTYLSFSNSTVQKALCQAVEERDVKVTFVLDSSSDTNKADALLACQPASGDPERAPRFEARGHTKGIGYAHNKIFLVNPGAETMRIAFSSGNMSSGTVLHHENWHFITLPSKTYFAQAHLCAMDGELDHYQSKAEYRGYLEECFAAIDAPQEGDIQAYFVPADRGKASAALLAGVRGAEGIDIAAHRFSYTKMINELKDALDYEDIPTRLIADDDMYWAGHGDQCGDNMSFEYYNAKALVDRGGQVRWMETNHASHLLHHNKFLIFDMPEGEKDAVFCGAGNLTGTGFTENWENYYYITIPEVVEAYRAQYEHMWNDLATDPADMPTENVMPEGVH